MMELFSFKVAVLWAVCSLFRRSSAESREDVIYGRVPMRGVNLGGWLVAEYWMTKQSPIWKDVPEDIAKQGEYKTMKFLGHGRGDPRFKQHRDNYITEDDFEQIKRANLNAVRIPVGYWITGFDHSWGSDTEGWKVFAPGTLSYLDRAIKEWAPRRGLLVFVSMHAAKGSQNGNDHSAPPDAGKTYWSGYKENVNNTLDTVEFLVQRYKNDKSFVGIGLLNEPAGSTDEQVLKQYYYDAYGRVRQHSDCLVSISPLLWQQGPRDSDWNRFMGPPAFQQVLHEWHRYQVWGFEGKDANSVISYAENDLKQAIDQWNGNWLFIGEWSLASSSKISDDQLKRYARAQLEAFKGVHAGWTFWTWKFYNDDGGGRNVWSMKSMINGGFIKL